MEISLISLSIQSEDNEGLPGPNLAFFCAVSEINLIFSYQSSSLNLELL